MNVRAFAAPTLVLLVVACTPGGPSRPSPQRTPHPVVAAPAPSPHATATPPIPDAKGVYLVGGPVSEPIELAPFRPEIPARYRHITGSPPFFIYEAVITTAGSVASLRLISGPPTTEQNVAIDRAYRTAIAQQRYRPATLHGAPVPVRITITAFPGVR